MNIWETVKRIQLFCDRLDLVHIAVLRRLNFLWFISSQYLSCEGMFL